MLVLGFAVASAGSLIGCAGETTDDESSEASEDAIVSRVLQPSECGAIRTVNSSRVAGVFDAPLNGCFLARGNETGAAMIERAVAIITNGSEIGGATNRRGQKMFSSFRASAPSGSIANGGTLAYDAKIGLDIVGPFDAKGTLRFSSQRTSTGGVELRVTNTTKIGALGINPIDANGLVFVVRFTPAQNGVVVTGSVKVTLVSHKDSVNEVSSVAPDIVSWLKGKLGAR
jgi:hypothetical protein